MSSFIFSGGVEVLGFISPTDTSDEYAVIDPLYGIDGLRNVSSISELNAITTLRRRPGMVVGVNNGSQYYKLNPAPWNGTLTDWSLFTPGIFTGGTVSGETNFTSGVTATIFSAGTYLNLPIDNTVTGGTYNPSNGSVTFTNNTGGTFTVTGFITGFTDIQVTGYTYSANTFTIYDSSGNTFSATINSMTGLTVNGAISATTISATTYQNLPSDIIIVNSTPVQSGFTGGVLFQSSASTVTQTTGFTWDNTNKRLGIGVNSPLYDLDVNGAIYQRTGELLITSSGGVNKEGPFIASSGGDEISSDRKIQIGISDNSSVPVGIDMFATNNSFPSSYINFRVNNADLVKMSGSSVGIGTTIDDGFRLYVSGDTRINGGLTATTISATTYQNLPSDVIIINSTQIQSGSTGGILFQSSASTVSQSSNLFWDNVSGRLGIRTTSPQAILHVANTSTTETTALFSGAGQNVVTIVGSGSTQPIFTVQGSSGELFSITDSLVGSLFSVNDISGLPILEVFSNNTTLMGSYLAPSLNTTAYVISTTGTTNVYSIPTSAYTGAFFDYTVSDGTNLRAGNIMSIWSGTSVNFTETSTTDFGNTSGLTFNMIVSSGNAILRTSGTTGNWTVKTIVRSI